MHASEQQHQDRGGLYCVSGLFALVQFKYYMVPLLGS